MFPAALLDEMMAPYLAAPSGPDRWLVQEDEGQVVAVAYVAPERLTAGTWNLLCIAVRPDRQSRGVGRALVAAVEAVVREQTGRVLLVETSGAPAFARTRAFYRQLGYTEEARLRDYYQAGEDKVVFRKPLGARGGVAAEPGLAVRDATSADLSVIVELAISLGQLHAGYDSTRFELRAFGEGAELRSTYSQFFEQALVDSESIVKVVVREGRVVGYAFARLEPASFLDLAAPSGWLHDVCLAQGVRGARVGRELIGEICAALVARGATRLRLSVSPQNARARALFESLGFRQTMLEMQRDA